jgi:arylsulfatase A-like enzyme
MLHVQDGHAMEPHCCHRFLAANGETDRPKLKLVPFVTRMDACLGRILEALEELGLADRTLVLFTSDHGTMLGQHGMMEKGVESFYDDMMRVPLIMRLPGRIPAGKTCPAYALSVDLAPTILDYLGARPLTKTDGRSLRAAMEVGRDDDRPVFGERGRLDVPHAARMIRTRQWKLSLLARGQKELFDLTKDPGETHNLAAEPAHAALVRELSAQLIANMRSVGDQGLSQFVK